MEVHDNKRDIYRVQAVDRAIDILDCFTYQNRELTVSDIVGRTGLNRPTARRLISNLKSRGLIQQDPMSKGYRLGRRLFELGGIVFSSFSLRRAAAYPMSRLQNKTGATTQLAVRMEDQLVFVDKREGHGMISMSSDIGWRRPLNYGAMGKVLTAYLEEKEIREILRKYRLQQYTPYSITDKRAFFLQLEKIRKQGYIIEVEEFVEGVMAVAAPIRDYTRKVIASICVGLPASKKNEKQYLGEIVKLVTKACDETSENLGYLRI